MSKAFLQHLQSSKDLETTYEAVRAGFVALALEKNRRATPLVAEARALKAAASRARAAADLIAMDEIRAAMLTAAGISEKAAGHLQDSDKREAIEGLIKNHLDPAGLGFVEELVFRFLLTRGDMLGGSMRNVGGSIAQRKLTRSMIAALRLAGRQCQWLSGDSGIWAAMPETDADIEINLRGLSWDGLQGPRTLLYNLTIPFVGNNVDLSLFNVAVVPPRSETMKTPQAYLALGELKGGIDPAGADEHWKTARTALSRVSKAFSKSRLRPNIFFIGAAIEKKMAAEIWAMLERGELSNAANLTNDDQIASIAAWLCGL
jgi:hypothetical protein